MSMAGDQHPDTGLGGIVLADHRGRRRTLSQWSGGRPLVIQMVRYYG